MFRNLQRQHRDGWSSVPRHLSVLALIKCGRQAGKVLQSLNLETGRLKQYTDGSDTT